MALSFEFTDRMAGWRERSQERLRSFADRLARVQFPYRFKSLTWHIIILNLIGLIVVVSGVFYASRTEAWLIEAKRESLLTQGKIIAAAIASNAEVTAGQHITFDPDALLPDSAPDAAPADESLEFLEFPIRPDKIARLLKLLIRPTKTRARIYGEDGTLILDSAYLEAQTHIRRAPLPPASPQGVSRGPSLLRSIENWFTRRDLPVRKDVGGANGKAYPEFISALQGVPTPILLVNEQGQHVISIAVPVRRMTKVLGVLLLSTRGDQIDRLIAKERRSILVVALIALGATLLLSGLLAATISMPLHNLSLAAERVRSNMGRREPIPDYTNRADEIGRLSSTLREMIKALYKRIERSERFAADVAHELKNPLTSVGSAAQTIALVKTDEQRDQLARTIQHDVRRLTRLIDDISNATRAEAELALAEAEEIDLADVLRTVTDMFNDSHRENGRSVRLVADDAAIGMKSFAILGHAPRIGQVFTNLVDNALSFSPEGVEVVLTLKRTGDTVRMTIEDEGPGIPPENRDKIFLRFYTDRPGGDETFGNNSGLGLSIVQDIVEAHSGTVRAEDRADTAVLNGEPSDVTGARFIVELPAAFPLSRRKRRGGANSG